MPDETVTIRRADLERLAFAIAETKAARAKADNAYGTFRRQLAGLEHLIASIRVQQAQ
ncbi:MAG: hypothetical protein M9932_11600 [Xanthobacteraceae bacterium]|nr:hypothetical protein [Xanthobacteraceae bacterium]